MKKILFPCLMLAASLVMLWSCDKDDKDGGSASPTEFADNYFTIENGTFHGESMPESTSNETITGVDMNDRALAGGFNFITINSNQEYDRFYVGVEGEDGYMEVRPSYSGTRSGDYYYSLPVAFGPNFSRSIKMVLKARTLAGAVTLPYSQLIAYEKTNMEGELTINLTFNKAKDLDLHLLTPSGQHIFYDNRTLAVTDDNGETITFGLDHDSNADCRIDNLNNENIVIPRIAIEPGVYQVYLELYKNCDTSIGTDLEWRLAVRYNGRSVVNMLQQRTAGENGIAFSDGATTVEGSNPVSGRYPYDALTRTQTYVMNFEVASMAGTRGVTPEIRSVYVPTLTDIAKELDRKEGIQ